MLKIGQKSVDFKEVLKMKKATKTLLLMLCAVVLVVSSVLGTVAYLTDTKSVENTFTVGNVTIELKEKPMNVETGKVTTGDLVNGFDVNNAIKFIPGRAIEKQPVITVGSTSEDCWLFVKVEDTKDILNCGQFVTTDEWEAVAGATNWYQRKAKATAGTSTQVFVSFNCKGEELDNADVEALAGATINVTAYAVQAEGDAVDSLTEAFAVINPPAP